MYQQLIYETQENLEKLYEEWNNHYKLEQNIIDMENLLYRTKNLLFREKYITSPLDVIDDYETTIKQFNNPTLDNIKNSIRLIFEDKRWKYSSGLLGFKTRTVYILKNEFEIYKPSETVIEAYDAYGYKIVIKMK